MPARWVDLLLDFNYVLDRADRDLDDADRAMFYSHVQATATRRVKPHLSLRSPHPLPAGDPLHARDPTGD